uniref:ATP synthase complex subunit 8 n=1 Tax=Subdoluseps bowringii TaxID=2571094 RepID=F2WSN0_9SAUR|nr:ATPase 8 [Subdoluseps bowringii]AEA37820.1 ATP synthase F0 subunit 8 [Subdoluseps bowringii]
MPQLNPAPWLLILILSWVTLLFLFKTKTTNATALNPTTAADLKADKMNPWNWPWT